MQGLIQLNFKKFLAKIACNVLFFISPSTHPILIQPNKKISINLSFQSQTVNSFLTL